MKPPQSLPDNTLRDYADRHLRYEIDMLVCALGILTTLGKLRNESPLAMACNNAFMNTFALHARNLIDFLYLRVLDKDRATDIIVQDYIDQEIVSKYLPEITDILKQAKEKADKQAAHLTKDRIRYEKSGKEWSIIEIAEDIMKAFRAVAPVFPENKLSDPFRQMISQSDLVFPQIDINATRSGEGLPVRVNFLLQSRKG